jgi:hypothetical protein
MKLWGIFTNIIVGRKLLMKKGAVITVTSDAGAESNISLAEFAALDGLVAADLAKIDGITNGTGAAGKALVLDASGNVAMPDNSMFSLSRAAVAAAGSTAADATVLADQINAVTGSDGAKGVALPAAATTTGPILVINTVLTSGANLLVYPVNGGNDNINAGAEDAAFTVGPGKAAWFIPTSATQWYVEDVAGVLTTTAEANILDGVTATAAELNYNDITTLGTGAASKSVVLDAGEDYTWPAAGILTYGVLKDPAATTIVATGAEINRACDVSTRVVNATASTLTVTEADHDGKTVVLDLAAGIAVTLPVASAGLKFRFVVKTTFTGAASIKSVAGTDIMIGHALMGNDTNDSVVDWQSLAASTNDTIDLFGTANSTGGIAGQVVTIEGLAANLWYVEIRGDAAGTEASPFSNTVA